MKPRTLAALFAFGGIGASTLVLTTGCPGLFAKPTSTPDPFALIAPPAGEGVQLHVGPFDVPEGQEVQRNYYQKFPSDADVHVKRVQIAMRPGSHHLNLFKSETESVPDRHEDTFDMLNFDKYDLFTGNQNEKMDWKLPAGVGIRFKAKQQILMQSHYVNATTQKTPSKAEAYINLWFAKPGEVTQNMGTLFANNKRLAKMTASCPDCKPIPPNSTASYAQWFLWEHPVTIAAMTGHFHSRGKRFAVSAWNGSAEGAGLYESKNWEEPPFKIFDGGIPVASGSGIRFTAEFVNNSDKEITFGGKVETQEHANLFLYFYPANAKKDLLFTISDASESNAAGQEQ